MDINEKIKNRRIELGLTMLEVAKKVGVSEATVSRWESGDIANMRRDKIVLLANALQVPPSFIMDLEEDEPKPVDLDKELEGVRFALYTETEELTDDDKQAVLDFVRFLKSKNKKEE
ncbi:helix-turn-helix domain-containing protein [Qingrenia yutianensis]|uniref:helix-turn-helix domain-containing protein n=1 Tax=Qingrenia yutianensis TaxID=2763676 RepID=UPI00223A8D2D|nr:helix-turn-helix transcriptional regulator [Qingrenia yutianensis]